MVSAPLLKYSGAGNALPAEKKRFLIARIFEQRLMWEPVLVGYIMMVGAAKNSGFSQLQVGGRALKLSPLLDATCDGGEHGSMGRNKWALHRAHDFAEYKWYVPVREQLWRNHTIL